MPTPRQETGYIGDVVAEDVFEEECIRPGHRKVEIDRTWITASCRLDRAREAERAFETELIFVHSPAFSRSGYRCQIDAQGHIRRTGDIATTQVDGAKHPVLEREGRNPEISRQFRLVPNTRKGQPPVYGSTQRFGDTEEPNDVLE